MANEQSARAGREHFLAELDQAIQSWHKRSGTMFDGEIVADELNRWFRRFRESTEWPATAPVSERGALSPELIRRAQEWQGRADDAGFLAREILILATPSERNSTDG